MPSATDIYATVEPFAFYIHNRYFVEYIPKVIELSGNNAFEEPYSCMIREWSRI